MATIPVEITLYEKMNTFFRGYDFLLMTDKKQFRRVTPTGFQNVIFTTTEYNNETWLEVNLGCRNEQIEQIAQQFLGNTRDYWEDANTLVISIGKFNNTNYFRYKILSEQDLEDTCEEIKLFLTEQGFPFLNKYDHLEAIHQLFNIKVIPTFAGSAIQVPPQMGALQVPIICCKNILSPTLTLHKVVSTILEAEAGQASEAIRSVLGTWLGT